MSSLAGNLLAPYPYLRRCGRTGPGGSGRKGHHGARGESFPQRRLKGAGQSRSAKEGSVPAARRSTENMNKRVRSRGCSLVFADQLGIYIHHAHDQSGMRVASYTVWKVRLSASLDASRFQLGARKAGQPATCSAALQPPLIKSPSGDLASTASGF